jgi:spore coat protein H
VARLRQLLDTWFTDKNIGARVDAMHALLAPYNLPGGDGKTVDPYVSPEHAARSAEYLHRFVHERREWLQRHIRDIEALGSGGLVIDRVGRDASGAFWVQLYNRGSTPVALGATLDPKHPEVSLFAADGKTALDLLWLAPLKPGEAYGRQPRGAESFGSQSGP